MGPSCSSPRTANSMVSPRRAMRSIVAIYPPILNIRWIDGVESVRRGAGAYPDLRHVGAIPLTPSAPMHTIHSVRQDVGGRQAQGEHDLSILEFEEVGVARRRTTHLAAAAAHGGQVGLDRRSGDGADPRRPVLRRLPVDRHP